MGKSAPVYLRPHLWFYRRAERGAAAEIRHAPVGRGHLPVLPPRLRIDTFLPPRRPLYRRQNDAGSLARRGVLAHHCCPLSSPFRGGSEAPSGGVGHGLRGARAGGKPPVGGHRRGPAAQPHCGRCAAFGRTGAASCPSALAELCNVWNDRDLQPCGAPPRGGGSLSCTARHQL